VQKIPQMTDEKSPNSYLRKSGSYLFFQYVSRVSLARVCIEGTVSRDGSFFEGLLNILISTFCVCDDGFQGLSEAFHYPIQLLTFDLLFLKLLIIF
jgi:hypothetical protein